MYEVWVCSNLRLKYLKVYLKFFHLLFLISKLNYLYSDFIKKNHNGIFFKIKKLASMRAQASKGELKRKTIVSSNRNYVNLARRDATYADLFRHVSSDTRGFFRFCFEIQAATCTYNFKTLIRSWLASI